MNSLDIRFGELVREVEDAQPRHRQLDKKSRQSKRHRRLNKKNPGREEAITGGIEEDGVPQNERTSDYRKHLEKAQAAAMKALEVRKKFVEAHGEKKGQKMFREYLKKNPDAHDLITDFNSLMRADIKAREHRRNILDPNFDAGKWDDDILEAVRSGKMRRSEGYREHLSRGGREKPSVLRAMERMEHHGTGNPENLLYRRSHSLGESTDYHTGNKLAGFSEKETTEDLIPREERRKKRREKSGINMNPFLPEKHRYNSEYREMNENEIRQRLDVAAGKSRNAIPDDDDGSSFMQRTMFGDPGPEQGRSLWNKRAEGKQLSEKEGETLGRSVHNARTRTAKRESSLKDQIMEMAKDFESGKVEPTKEHVKFLNETRKKFVDHSGRAGWSSSSAEDVLMSVDTALKHIDEGLKGSVENEDPFKRWRKPVSEVPGMTPSKSRNPRERTIVTSKANEYLTSGQAEDIESAMKMASTSDYRTGRQKFGENMRGIRDRLKRARESSKAKTLTKTGRTIGKAARAIFSPGTPLMASNAAHANETGRGQIPVTQGIGNRLAEAVELPARWAYEDIKSLSSLFTKEGGLAGSQAKQRAENRIEREFMEAGGQYMDPKLAKEYVARLHELKGNMESSPANPGIRKVGEESRQVVGDLWGMAKKGLFGMREKEMEDSYLPKGFSLPEAGYDYTNYTPEIFLSLLKDGGVSGDPTEEIKKFYADHLEQQEIFEKAKRAADDDFKKRDQKGLTARAGRGKRQGRSEDWWDQEGMEGWQGKYGSGKYDEMAGGSDRSPSPKHIDELSAKNMTGLDLLVQGFIDMFTTPGRPVDKDGRTERSSFEIAERNKKKNTDLNIHAIGEMIKNEKEKRLFKEWKGNGKKGKYDAALLERFNEMETKLEDDKLKGAFSSKLKGRVMKDKGLRFMRGSDIGSIMSKGNQDYLKKNTTGESLSRQIQKAKDDYLIKKGFRPTKELNDKLWESSGIEKKIRDRNQNLRKMIVPRKNHVVRPEGDSSSPGKGRVKVRKAKRRDFDDIR